MFVCTASWICICSQAPKSFQLPNSFRMSHTSRVHHTPLESSDPVLEILAKMMWSFSASLSKGLHQIRSTRKMDFYSILQSSPLTRASPSLTLGYLPLGIFTGKQCVQNFPNHSKTFGKFRPLSAWLCLSIYDFRLEIPFYRPKLPKMESPARNNV